MFRLRTLAATVHQKISPVSAERRGFGLSINFSPSGNGATPVSILPTFHRSTQPYN